MRREIFDSKYVDNLLFFITSNVPFISAVAVAAILFSMLPLIGWSRYVFIAPQSFCFVDWHNYTAYACFLIGFCFGLPFCVMTVCNILIIKTVRRSRMRVKSLVENTRRAESLSTAVCGSDAGKVSRNCPKNKLKRMLDSNERFAAENIVKGNSASESKEICIASSSQTQQYIMNKDPEYKYSSAIKSSLASSQLNVSNRNPLTTQRNTEKEEETAISVLTDTSSKCNATNTLNSNSNMDSQQKRSAIRKREIRLAFALIVIVGIFVICWLPYCLSIIIWIFYNRDVPRQFHLYAIVLGYATSGCNPIVYGVMNKRFKQGFKKQLCRWKK